MASFLDNIPTATKHILIVNVIMFLATLVNEDFMVRTFALFYPASPLFHIWQWLTHMFMHGGVWHILFNMYALFIFGSVLERALGTLRFLIFYFICGFGAMLLHTGVEYLEAQRYLSLGLDGAYIRLLRTPTLGASGAIYGVLMGFAMLYPNAVLTLIFPPIPLKAKWWILIFAAIELFTGITGTADGVAHFAHLGGMIFGFLLILLWRRRGILPRW
ncbi:MAG: rhomboid family intramembrane serine protease [Bacteroidales bacterium]|nr:rhomboid family intramembrane serine protease [Bacteroidales bacterium]